MIQLLFEKIFKLYRDDLPADILRAWNKLYSMDNLNIVLSVKLKMIKPKIYNQHITPDITMNNYQQAKQYTIELANNLNKIDLDEFFRNVHKQFYFNIDISFMQYFLEIIENDGEFVVPHSKLREYGIMTSVESTKVKDKLKILGLIKDEDYTIEDICKSGTSGTKYSKKYTLTPDAFKKCLMRAKRGPNQSVDPVIYIDYYLLLEKIFKLYKEYQNTYQEKLNILKDDKIDRLENKIDELLGYANYATDQIDDANDKIDVIQDELTETKEEVSIVKNHLIDKSLLSTKNPASTSLHHHFAATTFTDINGIQYIKFTTGTKYYLDKTVHSLIADSGHKVLIQPFYNANGFDLRQNCRTKFILFRRQKIIEINKKNASDDKKFNKALDLEIRAHNRKNPNNRRVFMREKRKTAKIKVKDIENDVVFNVLSVTYVNNPYIAFEDVINIVLEMNLETQTSPISDKE